MLNLFGIPSQRAEDSTYQANLVLADFRTRSESLLSDSSQARDAARDAVFRLVAIAEIFAGEHVLDVAERHLPAEDLIERVWDERSYRIVRDWNARKAAWKDLFDVKWDYSRRDELQGFVSARNIIAHGIGRLTRSQLQRGKIRKGVLDELTKARLRLDGFRLILDGPDVERCGDCVGEFIRWLDDESKGK